MSDKTDDSQRNKGRYADFNKILQISDLNCDFALTRVNAETEFVP